ncbi:hypothetical protein AVEN_243719-1 [Araneus ventricosus]|uniref:Uncharacterized protein n=1 Tax=Araneus ventricosus TaxID=182803 RepID=A0A4Y2A6K1_ARAVE|nr:hypothetical protein AVEN_243719-1 [Araneus ventricosus]
MRACPVAWDRHQLTLPNDVNRWNLEESLQLISRERASGQEQTEAVSLAAEKRNCILGKDRLREHYLENTSVADLFVNHLAPIDLFNDSLDSI